MEKSKERRQQNMNIFKCLQKTGGGALISDLQATLWVFNLLKSGLCGRCLSRRHTGLSNVSCYKTKLDSSLEGRKYRKEDHFRKIVIQYKSKGVKREMSKKLYSPTAWLKVRLPHHLVPDRDWGIKQEKHMIRYWEDDQPHFDENHMLLISNVKCWINCSTKSL